MTAHDLARQLLALPDLPVYLDDYEDGLTDVDGIVSVRVKRDTNVGPGSMGYCGEHEEVRPNEPGEAGLYLPRRLEFITDPSRLTPEQA